MSTTDVKTYKCDACGLYCLASDLPDTWLSITTEIVWVPDTRRFYGAKVQHACSALCEERLHRVAAELPVDEQQLEAEALARQPDLAKKLADKEREISALQAALINRELEHGLGFNPLLAWLRRKLQGMA